MEATEPSVKLKYKVPKTVGAAIDLLYKVRQDRRVLTKKADDEEKQEKLLQLAILAMFKKSDLEGGKGKVGQGNIVNSDVPTVKDKKKFYAYIKKTGAFDLLQGRLSSEAFRARWDAGKNVPGVEKFQVVKLSITKVGTKGKATVAIKSAAKKK